jgi:Ser-tRNA(Ala) deacylase AlaX
MNFTEHMNAACEKANALIKQDKVSEAAQLIREEAAKNPILMDTLQSIAAREKVVNAFSKGFGV